MAAKKYVQSQTLYLSGSGVLVGATSIVLTALTDIYGNAITSITAFGDKGYITLEPDTSNEEGATFTSVTANANGTVTLGGVSTILAQSPYTETSGLVRAHSGGTKVVITDNVAFWAGFTNRNNDEALIGRWTTPVTPSANNDLANKAYVDSVAVAGAPNANATTKGIVQEATQAQVDAGTASGSTGADLFPRPDMLRSRLLSDYKADTGSANAYAIAPSPAITAYTTGQLFSFSPANTNTGASTINVNGLGVKNIFRSGGALLGGEIQAGQICIVIYDGTQFELFSQTDSPSGAISMYVGAAAPSGWLLCDGTSYLRSTYPGLFAVIGTTFGSADGTHFNVPDMRGRAPVGVGTGTGGGASGTGLPTGGSALTARARGDWLGEETHTMAVGELATHHHAQQVFTSGSATAVATTAGSPNATPGSQGLNTQDTGNSTPFNVIQPVMALNFIIKT